MPRRLAKFDGAMRSGCGAIGPGRARLVLAVVLLGGAPAFAGGSAGDGSGPLPVTRTAQIEQIAQVAQSAQTIQTAQAELTAKTALTACIGVLDGGVEVTYEPLENLFVSEDGSRYVAAELREVSQDGPETDRPVDYQDQAGLSGMAVPIGPPDRWNRVPAWIVVDRGGDARLWQAERIGKGQAVFAPFQAGAACAQALRLAESRARRAGAGAWRNKGAGLAFSSARPKSFQNAAGRYVIVRGRIVSLGKTSRTRYLNFGRYWKTDLTGTLKTSDEDAFNMALGRSGWSLDDLAGRFVELRGTVENRDGPHIALRHPEQLVVLDD